MQLHFHSSNSKFPPFIKKHASAFCPNPSSKKICQQTLLFASPFGCFEVAGRKKQKKDSKKL